MSFGGQLGVGSSNRRGCMRFCFCFGFEGIRGCGRIGSDCVKHVQAGLPIASIKLSQIIHTLPVVGCDDSRRIKARRLFVMADFRRPIYLRLRVQHSSAPVYVPISIRRSFPEFINKQNAFNSSHYAGEPYLHVDESEGHILPTAGRGCRVHAWLTLSLEFAGMSGVLLRIL